MDRDHLRSQTLLACPHCRGDFLINEAGDGSISVEIVLAQPPPKRCDPPDEGGSTYTFKDDGPIGADDSPDGTRGRRPYDPRQ
jgi:uncharacterized protein YbaR (Trm112 family)